MSGSLRIRLFLTILIPLVLLSSAVGTWRVVVAQRTASELFDRNLMFTALAVSRDVALSDGDAVSPETEQLLRATAGGPVRYHVYAPDGVFVTGYAAPPVPLSRKLPPDRAFAYFDATYQNDPVRVLRILDEGSIDSFSGTFTITVWQDFDARNAFVWDLALRSFFVIATLILAVAALLWFGVRVGLKPLTDLEHAISRRSSEDLRPILWQVPAETRGLVARLNALFAQVGDTLEAQAAFVSDAAHQLRNPIAGLRALGESIQTARSLETAKDRANDLVAAASHAGELANRLLTLERAHAEGGTERLTNVDLEKITRSVTRDMGSRVESRGASMKVEILESEVWVLGDHVMLREALTNLIDNALVHGGPEMAYIGVTLAVHDQECDLIVRNDGVSLPTTDVPKILSRFGQAIEGPGSGLGLSIANAVAKRHSGRLTILHPEQGFAVAITLPLATPVPNGP